MNFMSRLYVFTSIFDFLPHTYKTVQLVLKWHTACTVPPAVCRALLLFFIHFHMLFALLSS